MPNTHPFAPLREPAHRFETPVRREALARLVDGLGAREPFLLVTGAPGTGKTVLLAAAVAGWGERAVVAFPSLAALAAGELVEDVVRRLGGDPAPGTGRAAMVAELERRLAEAAAQDRVTVLAIDDAQELAPERLEELRSLADAAARVRAPFEVVLAGTDALAATLAAPERAALRQRVSVRVTLGPLSAAETKHYLHHRVSANGGDGPGTFGRRACRAIAAASEGVPRQVDVLAHEAMRAAQAAGEPTVTPERVRAAALALWGEPAAARLDAAERDAAPARDPAPEAAPTRTEPREEPAARHAPAAPAKAARPAPEAAHRTPAPAKAARPAPEPAERTPAARDARAAAPAATAPAPEAPARPAPAAAAIATPEVTAPAAPQDPREWVARFVGDRGPVQIGSRAAFERARFEPEWEREPVPAAAPSARPSTNVNVSPVATAPAPAPSSPRHRRRLPALAGALVAIGAVAAIGLALRVLGHAHAVPAPDVARAVAPAPPVAAAPAPVVHVVPPAEASTPPVTRPVTPAASAGAATSPARDGRWAIDVGGYVDLDRALAERDRARERTGIQAWVVPAPEGSAGVHRIVLGIFHSSERANAAAEALLGAGSVREASVIPLPPKRDRR